MINDDRLVAYSYHISNPLFYERISNTRVPQCVVIENQPTAGEAAHNAPYIRIQLPGGQYCASLQPTIELVSVWRYSLRR